MLGHKISEKRIKVDKAKIEVMMVLEPRKMVKGIRSFLGHVGFYRKFIKDFSHIDRPLTILICKDIELVFDKDYFEAYLKIKTTLVSIPVVQPLDWELLFETICYASNYVTGAVLGQKKDEKLHMIYHASRMLDQAQVSYTTTKKVIGHRLCIRKILVLPS